MEIRKLPKNLDILFWTSCIKTIVQPENLIVLLWTTYMETIVLYENLIELLWTTCIETIVLSKNLITVNYLYRNNSTMRKLGCIRMYLNVANGRMVLNYKMTNWVKMYYYTCILFLKFVLWENKLCHKTLMNSFYNPQKIVHITTNFLLSNA